MLISVHSALFGLGSRFLCLFCSLLDELPDSHFWDFRSSVKVRLPIRDGRQRD